MMLLLCADLINGSVRGLELLAVPNAPTFRCWLAAKQPPLGAWKSEFGLQ